MVEQQVANLDTIFRALSDSTRRAMLRSLAGRAQTVTELAAPHDMSLAAAAKHVAVLERAGLLRKTARGRSLVCRLEAGRLADAHDWLGFYGRFWNERLDVLEDELRKAGDDQ